MVQKYTKGEHKYDTFSFIVSAIFSYGTNIGTHKKKLKVVNFGGPKYWDH